MERMAQNLGVTHFTFLLRLLLKILYERNMFPQRGIVLYCRYLRMNCEL